MQISIPTGPKHLESGAGAGGESGTERKSTDAC